MKTYDLDGIRKDFVLFSFMTDEELCNMLSVIESVAVGMECSTRDLLGYINNNLESQVCHV